MRRLIAHGPMSLFHNRTPTPACMRLGFVHQTTPLDMCVGGMRNVYVWDVHLRGIGARLMELIAEHMHDIDMHG